MYYMYVLYGNVNFRVGSSANASVIFTHVIDLPQQRARAHVRGDNCPVAPPPLWATYIS